ACTLAGPARRRHRRPRRSRGLRDGRARRCTRRARRRHPRAPHRRAPPPERRRSVDGRTLRGRALVIRRVVEPRGRRSRSTQLVPGGAAAEPHAPYSVDGAYAYCERVARGHFENYPLAVRFVPERLRTHLWALYAFARSADDFADEPRYAGRRRE